MKPLAWSPFHIGRKPFRLYVYPRSGEIAWARWFRDGRRHYQSLATSNPKLAKARAEVLHARAQEQSEVIATGSITMKAAITEYLTWLQPLRRAKTYSDRKYCLEQMLAAVGDRKLKRLTTADLMRYYVALYNKGRSPDTILSYNRSIRAWLNWCVEQQMIGANPTTKIERQLRKPDRTQIKAPPVASLDKLQRWAWQHDKSLWRILSLMRYGGLRIQEVLSREWADFDLAAGTVAVNHKPEIGFACKGHEDGVVPLPAGYCEILSKLSRRKGWYAADEGGSRFMEMPKNRFAAAKQATGTNDVTAHSFRHSYAHYMLTKGEMSLYKLAKVMRHASVTTTERHYGHFLPSEAAAEIKAAWPRIRF